MSLNNYVKIKFTVNLCIYWYIKSDLQYTLADIEWNKIMNCTCQQPMKEYNSHSRGIGT